MNRRQGDSSRSISSMPVSWSCVGNAEEAAAMIRTALPDLVS
jgi:hypothetical protein